MSQGIGHILKIPPRVRILRSLSVDPCYNLTLEDHLFQNNSFASHPVILLWQNSPSVFIGRFQNPWKEANISFLNKSGIGLVRRNSGGGAVFHDLGNCNVTVFSDRNSYNRKKNLEFVCHVLRKYFSLSCVVTEKLDIAYQGFKVSGTAARITRDKAYHHFTLLLSSNVHSLRTSLRSPLSEVIQTSATASLPSPTINLSTVNPGLTPHSFFQVYSNELLVNNDGMMDVSPDYREISSDTIFKSWDCVFGNTPKFTLTLNERFELTVEKGIISGIGGNGTDLFRPLLHTQLSYNEFLHKFQSLKRMYYTHNNQDSLDCFDLLIQNLPKY